MIGTHSAFPDSHGGITSLSEIVDSENFKVSGGAPKLVAVGASQLTKEAFALAANGSGEEEEDKKSGKSKKDKKKGKDASDEEEEMVISRVVLYMYTKFGKANQCLLWLQHYRWIGRLIQLFCRLQLDFCLSP